LYAALIGQMAHDFLGTFNLSMFNRLIAYARAQVTDIPARLTHLAAEQARVGSVVFKFDKATVVSYIPSPSDSYVGRLLRLYEVLGGDPFFDLAIRQKNSQAIFRQRADETRKSQVLSNGRVMATEGLADAPSAVLIQQMKDWMNDTLQYKRERLERQIRRTIDYSDQIADEMTVLRTIQSAASVDGSLENLIAQVNKLMSDRYYRAISDDKGQDPDGNLTHAPYAPLEPGPGRPVIDGYYRTHDGYVTPNDGSDNT
jgi:hypothetical protein